MQRSFFMCNQDGKESTISFDHHKLIGTGGRSGYGNNQLMHDRTG